MGYDDVITKMGKFGNYQRRIFFCLCLPAITCAFHEMAGVFLSAKTDFRCLLPKENPENATFYLPPDVMNISFPWDYKTNSWSQCQRYDLKFADQYHNSDSNHPVIKCDSFIYDKSQYESTATTEWNLVCDRAWLRATGDSAFMVGVMFGAVIFGVISDEYGRRKALFLALLVQLISGFLIAVSPALTSYVLFRAIVGSTTSGGGLSAFVNALEMVSPTKRLAASMVLQQFFTLGYVLVAVLAYCIRSWEILQIALTVPTIAILACWWFIPESARWLLTKGRVEEAKDLLKKTALKNGVELSPVVLDDLSTKESDIESADVKKASAFDLVRYPNLRKKTLLICLMWFVNSATYYGLSWNTSSLAGNDYVNFGLAGAVEAPSCIFLYYTLDKWGRRRILCGCMLLAGISLLCTLFVPADSSWMIVVLATLGKFAIASSSTTVLIFGAEQFPTVIRNVGLGASGIFGKLAAILAPHINQLDQIWAPLPFVIFGLSSVIAGVLSLLLPETLNTKLPESIEDGERLGKKTGREMENSNDSNMIIPSC